MVGRIPETENFGRQNAETERRDKEIRDALRIDGSQYVRLYEKMQALIADLDATVTALVSALSYTRAEVDSEISSHVASPGAIAPTTVTASGNVSSSGNMSASGDISASGPIYTPHGRANPVTTSWVAAAINVDGRIAVQPSALKFKRDVRDYEGSVVEGLRVVTYVMKEDPNETQHIGFIADEVDGVEPMAVAHEDGEPFALKYDALLGGVVRDLQRALARIDVLEAQSQ